MGGAPPLSVTRMMLIHPGCVRQFNEDVVAYVLPTGRDSIIGRGAFALVADGMGGHAAGEVASWIAADAVRRLYYRLDGRPPGCLQGVWRRQTERFTSTASPTPAVPAWVLPAQCWHCGTIPLILVILAIVARIYCATISCVKSAKTIRSSRSWCAMAQ